MRISFLQSCLQPLLHFPGCFEYFLEGFLPLILPVQIGNPKSLPVGTELIKHVAYAAFAHVPSASASQQSTAVGQELPPAWIPPPPRSYSTLLQGLFKALAAAFFLQRPPAGKSRFS